MLMEGYLMLSLVLLVGDIAQCLFAGARLAVMLTTSPLVNLHENSQPFINNMTMTDHPTIMSLVYHHWGTIKSRVYQRYITAISPLLYHYYSLLYRDSYIVQSY